MKILVEGILGGDEEIALSDNGLNDPKMVTVSINNEAVTVDLVELYRSVIPLLAKMTPPQVGQQQP